MKKVFVIAFFVFQFISMSCKEELSDIYYPLPLNPELENVLAKLNVDKYLDIDYQYYTEERPVNWVDYYFSTDDCKCIYGSQFFCSVRDEGSQNVIFYLEGGGAKWPNGGTATPYPLGGNDLGYKSRSADNPLGTWNVVYVPYCDGSIHSGDNEVEFEGMMHYFHGMKTTLAAVNLMKKLFPQPSKILVAGASAGGFGTFLGWAMVKYQYLRTRTYIFNDSGPGFWNPDDTDTWEIIKDTWQFESLIPEECTKCNGTTLTYLYETYMDYDDQVRIGMYSTYEDSVIGQSFLEMEPEDFTNHLLNVTDEIKTAHPNRFGRFFLNGSEHTALLKPMTVSIDQITLYEWLGKLVDDKAVLPDLLE